VCVFCGPKKYTDFDIGHSTRIETCIFAQFCVGLTPVSAPGPVSRDIFFLSHAIFSTEPAAFAFFAIHDTPPPAYPPKSDKYCDIRRSRHDTEKNLPTRSRVRLFSGSRHATKSSPGASAAAGQTTLF
jgi:hypothetical protein